MDEMLEDEDEVGNLSYLHYPVGHSLFHRHLCANVNYNLSGLSSQKINASYLEKGFLESYKVN